MVDDFALQWYPGHMAKAERTLDAYVRQADFVIEVADARAPFSSRNPRIDRLIVDRPRLLLLSKKDLAHTPVLDHWISFFADKNLDTVALTLLSPGELRRVRTRIASWLQKETERRGYAEPVSIPGVIMPRVGRARLRGVVVGMPNTGKSTLIRSLGGRGVKVGAVAGVTREISWIKVSDHIELLDTPGIMGPRSETGATALKLAWLGCVSEAAFDVVDAAAKLIAWGKSAMPEAFATRYRVSPSQLEAPLETLASIARLRGHLRRDDAPDLNQAAHTVIGEFRRGLLGKVALDPPRTRRA